MKILFCAIFLVFTAGVALAQNADHDDPAIRNTIRRLLDAQIAYDAKGLDTLLSKDYIEISPLGEFDPRDKVLGFYAPDQKPAGLNVNVEDTEYSIRSYKNNAAVIVRLNYLIRSNGQELPPRSIRATYLLLKGKTGWKIGSAQYTGIQPPQPAR